MYETTGKGCGCEENINEMVEKFWRGYVKGPIHELELRSGAGRGENSGRIFCRPERGQTSSRALYQKQFGSKIKTAK